MSRSQPFILYGRPGSGSGVCEAMLALCGLPYTIIDVEKNGDGSAPAALLAINPLGQVPVMLLPDGSAMTESAAIALYLADLAPNAGLAPATSHPDRARYLRWMTYLAANSYMTILRIYYSDRYSKAAGGGEAVQRAAIEQSAFEWSVFSDALGAGPFILGGTMSAADIYAAMLASWELDLPGLYLRHPNLERLCGLVAAHPVIRPIWKRHEIVA